MEATLNPRVKICCISSLEEARLAIRCGASALGLVSAMPSGPGPIGEELIAEIAAIVPPGVASFLLTSLVDAPGILTQQRRCRVNTLQIVDRVEEDVLRQLRDEMPGIALVLVIHVDGEDSIREAVQFAPLVDAILLDSGNPSLAVKELGGTGRRHDWQLSRRIREEIAVPLYLAGGLNPSNVREAVETVAPFGLDVCSGLRTDDRLDENKVTAFFDALQQ
ncbi:phosphoribosylanthranilate isomerase [bacterium]|nr:MAG: phosphoribosylanthranilate isomerase [bacterium]